MGDGDGVIEVDDGVPDSTRHEDGLSRVLDELCGLQLFPIFLSHLRQDLSKIVDGLIAVAFRSELLPLDDRLGN